jgi:hypothetical protein
MKNGEQHVVDTLRVRPKTRLEVGYDKDLGAQAVVEMDSRDRVFVALGVVARIPELPEHEKRFEPAIPPVGGCSHQLGSQAVAPFVASDGQIGNEQSAGRLMPLPDDSADDAIGGIESDDRQH